MRAAPARSISAGPALVAAPPHSLSVGAQSCCALRKPEAFARGKTAPRRFNAAAGRFLIS